MDPRLPYWLPNLVAGVLMVLIAVRTWVARPRLGADALFVASVGAAIWSLCEGLLFGGFSLAVRQRIAQVQYLGVASAPLAMAVFVAQYVGRRDLIRPSRLRALAAPCVVVLALAWTNSFHHLVWTSVSLDRSGSFAKVAFVHGPALGAYFVYAQALIVTAVVLLWQARRQATDVHRLQLTVVMWGISVPAALNAVYFAGLSPVPHIDLTAVGFSAAAVALAWAFVQGRLLDVIPVAKDEIFRSLSDGVLVFDSLGHCVDANPAAESILGVNARELVGRPAADVLVSCVEAAKALTDDDAGPVEHDTVDGDGLPVTYEIRQSPLVDRNHHTLGRLLVWHDITERKSLEAKLEQLATTDPLTGAFNRRVLWTAGEAELERLQRYGRPFAVCMVDLDHFKLVNDAYGHEVGDRLLVAVVGALRTGLRTNDRLARLGGEELAVLLPETERAAGRVVAERLLQACRDCAVDHEGHPVTVTGSIGLTIGTADDATFDYVMKRADEALYRAKAAGRNRICEG